MLEGEADKWSEFWAPNNPELAANCCNCMDSLRTHALAQVGERKFSTELLIQSIKGYNRESCGVDNFKTSDFKKMPVCALEPFADSLEFSIQNIALPLQILVFAVMPW